MKIDQDEILDENKATNVAQLTDRQLIGFLLDQEKFPEEIMTSVAFEVQQRKFSNAYIETLEAEFNPLNEATISFKERYHLPLLLVLLVVIVAINSSNVLWQILILFTSARAINKRLTEGVSASKKTWRKFEFGFLGLNSIVYILLLFY